MLLDSNFLKDYEELNGINEEVSTRKNIDWTEIDKAVKATYSADTPGDGASFITPDGTFINNFGEVHDDLRMWVVEKGFITLPDYLSDEADWDWGDLDRFLCNLTSSPDSGYFFVCDPLNYIKCNNEVGQCYIVLPSKPSRLQLCSLEQWFEDLKYTNKTNRPYDIEFNMLGTNNHKYYKLAEYEPEDFIKLIKRCYASGRFYEHKIK